MNLNEIIERCRELHGPWLAAHGEDVQISLLTAEEISATVVSEESETMASGQSLKRYTVLSAARRLGKSRPLGGAESDSLLIQVSWDYDGKKGN